MVNLVWDAWLLFGSLRGRTGRQVMDGCHGRLAYICEIDSIKKKKKKKITSFMQKGLTCFHEPGWQGGGVVDGN